MLPIIEDPNTQKQLKRSEQIKKWNERESMASMNYNNNNNNNNTQEANDEEIKMTNTIEKYSETTTYHRPSRVRFPKGCVFLAACSSGDTDEVRAHLKLGVNINTTNIDGLTALHQACIDANIEMVKFLVENNADINAQDNEGWTPLHAAVSVGNLDVAKFLINKGAKLNICNNDSDLPIDLCDTTNTQMKEFLEDEMRRQNIDADFERKKEELLMYEDARDKKFEDKVHAKTGATPLHVSAAKGYTRVMRILLQSGADVNALDKDGWTPLHAAAHWEQEEACKILCENGADFEIRNYSEQTPYDVCENEMVNKLKQLEATYKSKTNKLNDVTPTNNKLNSHNNKQSNQLKKPSFSDTIPINEKKEEIILLSPIVIPQTNSTNNNESVETTSTATSINSKSNEIDKENELSNSFSNLNGFNNTNKNENNNSAFSSSSSASTTTTTISNSTPTNQQEIKNPISKPLLNSNRAKPGLHESLKSLSAQVRMMDEEKDEDKSARWGPTDTSTTTTATFKRRTAEEIKLPTATVATTSSLANSSPLSPPLTTNDTVPSSPNSLNTSSDSANRRYSSAPIASKDEQAELIRKQKAKLERHFRRSTTAVSYEDIKSAEATIKGGVSSTNLTTKTDDKTPTSSPISSNTINLTGTTNSSNNNNNNNSNNNDQPPSTPPPPIPTTSTSSITLSSTTAPSNPIALSGVSSLSTLFGESIKQSNYYHTPATFSSSSSNSLTPLAQSTSALQQSSSSSLIDSQKNLMSKLQIELTPTSNSNNNNNSNSSNTNVNSSTNINNNTNTNSNESTEKDQIIANDIETDKLLNVIEKSKGFSDSKSTTAIRRLRNRQIPIFGLQNLSNDENQSGGNVKKIHKLVWNPDRLEIEYKDEDQRASNASPELTVSESINQTTSSSNSAGASANTTTTNNRPNLSPELVRKQNSSDNSTENATNTNSNSSTTTNLNTLAMNNAQPHTGRSLFRFDSANSSSTPATAATTNSNGSSTAATNNTNSLINRTSIKRSVSQVPSTDRRPLGNASSSSFLTSPSSSSSQTTSATDGKIFDYQAAYEQTKKENETLNQTILQMRKELEEFKRNQATNENGTLDKREKRAFDRRISELEEEVKKIENLKQDNSRLKEENAALIRVISKLSK